MRRLSSNWQASVMVCRKCSKRIGGGFGPKGKEPLAKALRRALGGGKRRKDSIGIVEVRCLGVCPARGVTMVDGRNPGEWLIVKAGSDVEAVAKALSDGKAHAGGSGAR